MAFSLNAFKKMENMINTNVTKYAAIVGVASARYRREERPPSDMEVQAAAWGPCGHSGALQLLVDLLNIRITELEEHSGTEDSDTDLLEGAEVFKSAEQYNNGESKSRNADDMSERYSISRNKWSRVVYRRCQKQLTHLFLKEAEHALELALSEGN